MTPVIAGPSLTRRTVNNLLASDAVPLTHRTMLPKLLAWQPAWAWEDPAN